MAQCEDVAFTEEAEEVSRDCQGGTNLSSLFTTCRARSRSTLYVFLIPAILRWAFRFRVSSVFFFFSAAVGGGIS